MRTKLEMSLLRLTDWQGIPIIQERRVVIQGKNVWITSIVGNYALHEINRTSCIFSMKNNGIYEVSELGFKPSTKKKEAYL